MQAKVFLEEMVFKNVSLIQDEIDSELDGKKQAHDKDKVQDLMGKENSVSGETSAM